MTATLLFRLPGSSTDTVLPLGMTVSESPNDSNTVTDNPVSLGVKRSESTRRELTAVSAVFVATEDPACYQGVDAAVLQDAPPASQILGLLKQVKDQGVVCSYVSPRVFLQTALVVSAVPSFSANDGNSIRYTLSLKEFSETRTVATRIPPTRSSIHKKKETAGSQTLKPVTPSTAGDEKARSLAGQLYDAGKPSL